MEGVIIDVKKRTLSSLYPFKSTILYLITLFMTEITTLHSLNEKIITGIRKLLMKRWELYYTINRKKKS